LTRYISTRGEAPVLGFCDVMLTGLARDGGLYVPEVWPQLPPGTIAGFFGRPYWEVAVDVIKPFAAGEISDADLGRMANEAYATFRHPAVVPLDQIGPNQFLLELFHGPTLAFKDVAMQLISPAARPSTPLPASTMSISSCCSRTAASPRCSGG
jgi:threonine synthase